MINDDAVAGIKKECINNSSISKNSKLSISKLAAYVDNSLILSSQIDSPRKYGSSSFHSSSSLQNSINSISFPKSSRFITSERISPGFYKLPDYVSKRSAAIGYDVKMVFEKDKESPSPNAYTIQSIFEENLMKKKGTIFHPRIEIKNGVKTNINIFI
jgi:hypothetical protein